jgi:flagellar basal-body rod protein FlgG
MRGSTLAAVTMGQLQKKLDLIGHNMANVNTTGYKAKTANFSSLLVQQINNQSTGDENAPRLTPAGIRQGNGARLAHTNVNMATGTLTQTDRPLDVALTDPKQFFQVQVAENGITETQFTRAGNFYLQPINANEDMLVTAEGNPVVGTNGPIILQNGYDGISISDNGEISITRGNQTNAEAQLQVVQIDLPRSLETTGGNRYRLPANDLGVARDILVDVVDDVKVKSGTLESSNVNLSEEMTSMLEFQRAYQLNARSITIGDQMMNLINQLR